MEYSINLYLSFLVGIVLKIYDDIIDEKLNVNVLYIDFLKYLTITLFSIIFYNDIIFSILWFYVSFLSHLMDIFYTSKLEKNKDTIKNKDLLALNDNIWKYLYVIAGCFIFYHTIVNYSSFKNFTIFNYKNLTFLINILISSIIVLGDIYFTPEHSSGNKLYARICVFVLLSLFIYYMTFLSNYIYQGNYSIMLLFIGFLIASISFLSFDKFKMFDSLKNKQMNSKVIRREKKTKKTKKTKKI